MKKNNTLRAKLMKILNTYFLLLLEAHQISDEEIRNDLISVADSKAFIDIIKWSHIYVRSLK